MLLLSSITFVPRGVVLYQTRRLHLESARYYASPRVQTAKVILCPQVAGGGCLIVATVLPWDIICCCCWTPDRSAAVVHRHKCIHTDGDATVLSSWSLCTMACCVASRHPFCHSRSTFYTHTHTHRHTHTHTHTRQTFQKKQTVQSALPVENVSRFSDVCSWFCQWAGVGTLCTSRPVQEWLFRLYMCHETSSQLLNLVVCDSAFEENGLHDFGTQITGVSSVSASHFQWVNSNLAWARFPSFTLSCTGPALNDWF